ncbi:hypothetical protein ACFUTU_01495 [Arthrobacter sp. NPDC057388]|uniref:hypothetical protein n=1 Tax=Arthrobacter sp. NPDC057388 TaxID=3346116 RepID=UPI0036410915
MRHLAEAREDLVEQWEDGLPFSGTSSFAPKDVVKVLGCDRIVTCDLVIVDGAHGVHHNLLAQPSPPPDSPMKPTCSAAPADRLEFSEGADWCAAGIGANAISEALVTSGPVQLFAAEHLVRTHHDWARSAAPITYPATGQLCSACWTFQDRWTPSARTHCGWCGAAVRVAESLLGMSDGGASLGASSPVRASRVPVRRPPLRWT